MTFFVVWRLDSNPNGSIRSKVASGKFVEEDGAERTSILLPLQIKKVTRIEWSFFVWRSEVYPIGSIRSESASGR